MNASDPETIYSAGSGDCTQARLITVSDSARTVPMSHRDKPTQHPCQTLAFYDRQEKMSASSADMICGRPSRALTVIKRWAARLQSLQSAPPSTYLEV